MSRVPEELKTKGQYWTRPWNPIRVEGGGFHCTKISPGCANCWAETMNLRGGGKPYDSREYRYELAPGFEKISKMRNEVVAVQWMSDLFHQDYPNILVREVLHTLNMFNSNIYLILTKRVDRFLWLAQQCNWTGSEHIFVGVTVESPKYLYRLENLMKWPGKKFLSIEPCLDAVYLSTDQLQAFKQIIIGCESGAKRRQPPHNPILREMIRQCEAADVPVFVKQWEIDGVIAKMPILNGGVNGIRWDQLAW